MRLLYVNDSLVDLADNQVVALTKQSNDIFDFQNKRSNLSNTLKLPKTDTNNLIFGNANDLNSTEIIRDWFTVKYIQDYEEVISYGRGKLVSGLGNYYEFIIYWGNIDLVAILGDKTLRDLDLADLRKLWNLTNVAALTITGAQSKDINYPILNTHDTEELRSGLTTGTALYPARMLPFISCRRLLTQIFTDNGLVADGDIKADILDITDIQQDLFIPVIDRQTDVDRRLNIVASVRELLGAYNSKMYDSVGVNTEKVFEIANFTDGVNEFYDYYEADEIATYQLKCNLNMGIKYLSTESQFLLEIISNLNCAVVLFAETDSGTGIFPDLSLGDVIIDNLSLGYVITTVDIESGFDMTDPNLYDDILQFWSNLNYIFEIGELTISKQLQVGERVRFRAYLQTSLYTSEVYYSTAEYHTKINLETGTLINIQPTIVQFGEYYPIAENLPEIQQIDFVKFIAAYFGYLIDVDDGTNIVRFKKLSNVLSNILNAQDWSNNIEHIEISDYHCELAQSNYMNYNNEDSLEDDGRGVFNIADNTLSLVNNFYTAPFSASSNETWDNQNTIIGRYPIIKVWNEAFNKVKPRIFKLRLENFTHCQIGIDPYIDATQKYVAYFAASQSWRTVLSSRYLEYQAMMNDYKKISAICYFTTAEFKAINMLEPVWVEQLSSYFQIKIVPDFVEGKKVKIELIKL